MISPRSLANALAGMWLLLKFDLRAWAYFDKTFAGFWASFLPALILAPLHFSHRLLLFSSRKGDLNLMTYLLVEVLAYIVSWTLFPFVMMYIVQLLQRTPRYYWHMVSYNWLQLPMNAIVLAVFLLADGGLVRASAALYAQLGVIVTMAVYGTFLAGVGLQVATGTALSLVVLDLVLSMVTNQLVSRIH